MPSPLGSHRCSACRPVQKYLVQVDVNAGAGNCSSWRASRAKRPFIRCAASLSGQPTQNVNATCTNLVSASGSGSGGGGTTKQLLIKLSIKMVGRFRRVKIMADTLVADINDGSFGMCLWAEGVTSYKKLEAKSSRLSVPNPRLAT